MGDLPTGTVTFMFTDIEGSTRLLSDLGDRFTEVLERHQAIIRDALRHHAGVEVKTEGDSFFCVFNTAQEALAAAVSIQRRLAGADWPENRPVRVRIGVHTGVAALGGDDYVGMDVNRGARISETGHGGQVLVSAQTYALAADGLPDGASFLDLGDIHLRDLDKPEHVYQLVIEGLDAAFPPLRKLMVGPTNLPTPASSFVGREREVADIRHLIEEARLVTITGVAGSGKSRLALEVASQVRESFPDGVWMVELAAVASDDLTAQTVAHALGLQQSSDRTAAEVVSDYLHDGSRLLILDNCEDAIAGTGDLATHLLATTRDLKIMATSQQVVGISGERRYLCPPLATPIAPDLPLTELSNYDSIALFNARAAETDPTFALSDVNAAAVAAICRRLDGMPLAIELAAALVRILAPAQILDRLDDRFDLLTGGLRGAPEHQRTLRAALDSTFELLDADRQEFASRLGVFVGGFDVPAAEAVAAGGGVASGDVIGALSALADRSLLTTSSLGGELRIHIAESVREYLMGRLEERGMLLGRRIAHARHYGSLVDAASRGLRGPEQDRWDRKLETDIDNIRAAIQFTSETGDDAGLSLVNQMFLYWRTRGDWSDGLHWTRRALESAPTRDSGLRARALASAGFFASDIGAGGTEMAELEEALAMARRVGDLHSEGYCSSFLGAELSRRDADLDRGLELLIDAQRIYREVAEPYGGAWVNRYLALSFQERGELDQAISLHTESLAAFQAAEDWWNIRFAQALLAEARHTVSELSEARRLYDESLRGSGDDRYKVVIAHARKGLGKVSLAEAKLDEADRHLQVASQQLKEIGDVACSAETTGHLAMVNLRQGHGEAARQLLSESLAVFDGIADKGGVAWALERLAAAAAESGGFQAAAEMLGAGASIRNQTGSMRSPVDQPDFDEVCARVEKELGDADFRAAFDAGGALELDEAVRLGAR